MEKSSCMKLWFLLHTHSIIMVEPFPYTHQESDLEFSDPFLSPTPTPIFTVGIRAGGESDVEGRLRDCCDTEGDWSFGASWESSTSDASAASMPS